MTLKPNLTFVPKVVGSCSPIHLVAFAAAPGEQRSHVLFPVRAVRAYMDNTGTFRRNPHKGKPITKQRLYLWVVEAIALANTSQGLQPPAFLQVHSTHGLAAYWALFRRVTV